MPKVNGKRYAYTTAGKSAAKKAATSTKKKTMRKKGKK